MAVLIWRLSSYIVPHPCVYWSFVQTQLFVRNASLAKQAICLNLLLLLSSTHVGAWNNLPHLWKTNVPCSTCTIKTFQLRSRPSASWRNKNFLVSHINFLPRDLKVLCRVWEVAKSTESLCRTMSLFSKFMVSIDILLDTCLMDLLERFPQPAQGTISVPLAVRKTQKQFPYIPRDS